MIKTTVHGYPVIYQNDNSYSLPSHTGAVQWNGNTKKFQVSSGSNWFDIDNNITYNADNNLMNVIMWAEKKMREEKELEEKAKTNTTIADLLQQRKNIEEKIKTVETLIR